ncbi:group II intron maturase-specific domain-containing protein [Vreelandella massiliensis]|uniref:group II intron maturase-specific domain-containing protein n=1 Tax=Vreelandella massiliensis TaxID=1816686 RepID=UPI00096A22FC
MKKSNSDYFVRKRMNKTRVMRGWCQYFRHGLSAKTFSYHDSFAFWRVVNWVRNRHLKQGWGKLIRLHLPGWLLRDGRVEMFRHGWVEVTRYRYRGARTSTPWASDTLA